MESKIVGYIWKGCKMFIFFSFIYVAIIMYRLRDFNTAVLITFTISIFMLFNKIENMDKRIKMLEVK